MQRFTALCVIHTHKKQTVH